MDGPPARCGIARDQPWPALRTRRAARHPGCSTPCWPAAMLLQQLSTAHAAAARPWCVMAGLVWRSSAHLAVLCSCRAERLLRRITDWRARPSANRFNSGFLAGFSTSRSSSAADAEQHMSTARGCLHSNSHCDWAGARLVQCTSTPRPCRTSTPPPQPQPQTAPRRAAAPADPPASQPGNSDKVHCLERAGLHEALAITGAEILDVAGLVWQPRRHRLARDPGAHPLRAAELQRVWSRLVAGAAGMPPRARHGRCRPPASHGPPSPAPAMPA